MSIEWIIVLLLLGIVIGFTAGLLGVGGGGIMVPVLTSIFLAQGVALENVVHLALGTSMASIVLTSIASFRAHHKNNAVLWPVVWRISAGVIIGALAATFLVTLLSTFFLTLFFTIFMAYVSLQMLFNKKPNPSRQLAGNLGLFSGGGVIGAVSSLVSIGGGALSVPFLMWQNVAVKKAIGTSAAIGFPLSVAGTLGYIIYSWGEITEPAWTFGYVYLPAVICISLTSFFIAPFGAKAAHKLPVPVLKKVFAVVLMLLSLKMLLSILT